MPAIPSMNQVEFIGLFGDAWLPPGSLFTFASSWESNRLERWPIFAQILSSYELTHQMFQLLGRLLYCRVPLRGLDRPFH